MARDGNPTVSGDAAAGAQLAAAAAAIGAHLVRLNAPPGEARAARAAELATRAAAAAAAVTAVD